MRAGNGALPPEAPLVLKGSDGRRRVVTAANRSALASGLRIGMPLTKAQALVEDLAVCDAEPEADAEALESLALWALRTYSPIVAADPPDGVVLDVTGAAHLHGGEGALLEGLIRAMTAEGIEARAAMADTWGAAHAVARYATRSTLVVPPGESSGILPRLPIAALRLPYGTVAALDDLGFETIGEVASQPRAPLVHRFGVDFGRRLDQAFGRMNEPIEPVGLPERMAVERVFAEPIGAAETIARYTGKLVVQLCDRLEDRVLGARQLDLVFYRVDNRIEAVRIGMAQPVRDVVRLTRLLCDKIETVDPGFGIERMRLTATEAEALAPQQTSSEDQGGRDLSDLIDVLANRIGAERIYSLSPVASDVPERSQTRVTALETVLGTALWPAHWPRPVRLLAPPEKITALAAVPDYPPKSLTWRGEKKRIVAADGPERIFGEWWRRDAEIAAVRDYYRIETEDGQRLWIYRTGDTERLSTGDLRWFVHGVFACRAMPNCR